MSGLPTYEETQHVISAYPAVYENNHVPRHLDSRPPRPIPLQQGTWPQQRQQQQQQQQQQQEYQQHGPYQHQQQYQQFNSYPYRTVHTTTPHLSLQVNLPPSWAADCATLTNYHYQTAAVSVEDPYSFSQPSLLLDRHGNPLRPGTTRAGGLLSGSDDDPLILPDYTIGDYLNAQEAIEDDIHVSGLSSSPNRVGERGTGVNYEQFALEDEEERPSRRRERTCAKGFFVVSLIVSAVALVGFLVIAVLKSVHII